MDSRTENRVTSLAPTLRAVVVCVFVVSCGAAVEPPSRPVVLPESQANAGVTKDAEPDRLACVVDADCIVSPYRFSANPCCVGFADAHSVTWDGWLQQWLESNCPDKKSHCTSADYPSLAPAPPPPCYVIARCRDGRCGNDCG